MRFLVLAVAVVGLVQANSHIDNLFNKIEVANTPSVFDRHGTLQEQVLDNWSKDDLLDWLKAHSLTGGKSSGWSYDDLKTTVWDHKEKLSEDLQQYLKEAQKQANPILSKSDKAYQQATTTLFDQAINAWSDVKLQTFLAARGISDAYGQSRDKLIELVKSNRDAVARSDLLNWQFDAWSVDDLKAELNKLGQKAEGSRQDLINRLSESYQTSKDSAAETWESILKQVPTVNFDTWSVEDLKQYLADYGYKTDTKDKSQLVHYAKEQYNWLIHGTSAKSDSTWGKLTDQVNIQMEKFQNWLHKTPIKQDL